MGAAAAPAAAGASIASTGFQVAGELMKGKAEAAGAKFEADKARRQAEYGRLQADQVDVGYREQLVTTIGNIDAIRAAADADPTSPTAVAIKANEQRVSDRERLNKVFSLNAQARENDAAAAYRDRVAKDAIKSSYVRAAAKAFSGISQGIAAGG